jgi:hypothetical protein
MGNLNGKKGVVGKRGKESFWRLETNKKESQVHIE